MSEPTNATMCSLCRVGFSLPARASSTDSTDSG